jgi:N-acetylglucosamine-6-sulfatase
MLGLFGALGGISSAPAHGGQVSAAGGPPPAYVGLDPRPDIVLVVLDDVRADIFTSDTVFATVMPRLHSLVAMSGVNFTQALTVNSWCCPGRASIQTGTWSHTNGVWTNAKNNRGGWEAFKRVDGSTVATWLHDGGYRTGLIGKSFNGAVANESPPGWDVYETFVATGSEGNEGGAYYNYHWWEREAGEVKPYGSAPADYSTDMTAGRTRAFLSDPASNTAPTFLYWAPYASHGPFTPPPRYATAFGNLHFAAPPSLQEDVSDKPAYIRARPPTSMTASSFQHQMQVHARPLAAVDDGIGALTALQSARGRLDDTVWVVVGDNGLMRYEHRWGSKEVPYEESIRVPLMVAAPGGVPAQSRALVGTADVAPTIADYAGVAAAGARGASMRPFVEGGLPPWRSSFLIAHLKSSDSDLVPSYCAVRTTNWLYAVYATGERELYTLRADPFELENLAGRGLADEAAKEQLLHGMCWSPPPGMPRP